jgi:hypothetical protein
MKSILMRSMTLAALALGLAACGGSGDDDEYVVKGRLFHSDMQTPGGVVYTGLTLKNGSDTITVKPGDTTFQFPTRLGYGDLYQVSILSNPDHQDCVVQSPALDNIQGRDVAGRLTDIDVVVSCQVKVFNVVVKTENPIKDMVLTNGSTGGTHTLTADTTSVKFPVRFGQSYGITIVKPENSPCRIEGGVGEILVDGDVENKAVLKCPAP